MTVRDSAPLYLSGTAFQAVDGDASDRATGEMWENQLSLREHFLPLISEDCLCIEAWFSQIEPVAGNHPP
jgi:hypothetical protein